MKSDLDDDERRESFAEDPPVVHTE
jgi:hypothetical protein